MRTSSSIQVLRILSLIPDLSMHTRQQCTLKQTHVLIGLPSKLDSSNHCITTIPEQCRTGQAIGDPQPRFRVNLYSHHIEAWGLGDT